MLGRVWGYEGGDADRGIMIHTKSIIGVWVIARRKNTNREW